MKTSFSKWTALIVLLLVIIGAGAWLLMRSLGTSSAPAQAETGGRKVLYYKSTMMLGEISQTSRKDSMGMDMVPVYEGEARQRGHHDRSRDNAKHGRSHRAGHARPGASHHPHSRQD